MPNNTQLTPELKFHFTHFNKVYYKDNFSSCVMFVNRVSNLELIEDTDCLEFTVKNLTDPNAFEFAGYRPSYVTAIKTKFHLFDGCVIVILSEPMVGTCHKVEALKCSVLSKEVFAEHFNSYLYTCELKYSNYKEKLYSSIWNTTLEKYEHDDSFERYLQLI